MTNMDVMINTYVEKPNINKKPRRLKGKFWETMRRMRKSHAAIIGLVLCIVIILAALSASFFFKYDDAVSQNIVNRLQNPSLQHPFGTDQFGRDIFIRVIFGAKYSLAIGFLSCILCLIVGVPIGAIAGYKGGVIDDVFMRFFDVLLALPSILLALIIVASLGANLINIVIALSLSLVPQYVRIARAAVMVVKDMEYVEASRAVGGTTFGVIVRHILPNCFSPILVQATLRVATVIADAACLSFLGLGIPAPAPEWGVMLSEGRAFLRDTPHLVLFPGIAIVLTILSLNLLGDGLRDALDPKLKN